MAKRKKALQGGGIIVHDQQVVLRRTKSGRWVFPKGHVEPGETTLDAARREAEEETGLQVVVLESLGSVKTKTDDEKLTIEYFLMRSSGPGPDWERHRNVDTFLIPPEQIPAHLSYGYLRKLWEKCCERVEALLLATQPRSGH